MCNGCTFQTRLPILEAGATFGLTSAFTAASHKSMASWISGRMLFKKIFQKEKPGHSEQDCAFLSA
jgi:hypothetical protein